MADQDVISIAASGAVSSDTAIAVSISAGVGVGRVEASIGDADINTINTGAHSDQDVVVRAVSDTYWTDVSGAIAVGTGLSRCRYWRRCGGTGKRYPRLYCQRGRCYRQ